MHDIDDSDKIIMMMLFHTAPAASSSFSGPPVVHSFSPHSVFHTEIDPESEFSSCNGLDSSDGSYMSPITKHLPTPLQENTITRPRTQCNL